MIIDKLERIGIYSLIMMVRENKYCKLIKKKENEMSNEEKRELKYFQPIFLTAKD